MAELIILISSCFSEWILEINVPIKSQLPFRCVWSLQSCTCRELALLWWSVGKWYGALEKDEFSGWGRLLWWLMPWGSAHPSASYQLEERGVWTLKVSCSGDQRLEGRGRGAILFSILHTLGRPPLSLKIFFITVFFTMFCQFLLYSKVTQSYIYIHTFFFINIILHHVP